MPCGFPHTWGPTTNSTVANWWHGNILDIKTISEWTKKKVSLSPSSTSVAGFVWFCGFVKRGSIRGSMGAPVETTNSRTLIWHLRSSTPTFGIFLGGSTTTVWWNFFKDSLRCLQMMSTFGTSYIPITSLTQTTCWLRFQVGIPYILSLFVLWLPLDTFRAAWSSKSSAHYSHEQISGHANSQILQSLNISNIQWLDDIHFYTLAVHIHDISWFWWFMFGDLCTLCWNQNARTKILMYTNL